MVTTPTNDGLTLARVMFPIAEFDSVKSEMDRHFMAGIDLVPELAQLVRSGERADRYYGTGDLPNFFRRPYCDG
jgi:hypothetical protein